ncbi:MAG: TIGR00282 family metallophosphoesterase [Synergistaceae bacterium]|nr:TIGR00282 family metallophosphoesterase [Synergistaceae bacterium]
MRVLFIGDVVGKPGRTVLAGLLPSLKTGLKPDFVIINCENASSGKGLTERGMKELYSLGIDGMTSGNHIWDKKDIYGAMYSDARIIRPQNMAGACPGQGHTVIESNGMKLGLLNLQGRVFMPPIDCPFAAADHVLENFFTDNIPVLVDFHAEATSEKTAMSRHLDGRVSALIGTHTHVQTSDETVLPGGTAYITDVGMTGGHGGIIGNTTESVLPKFLTGMPCRFEVCEENMKINAVLIDIDGESSRAADIKRINELFIKDE